MTVPSGPVPTGRCPAAQYLRVSSAQQAASMTGQAAEIAAYALLHGFEIVRTYEDPGRSGLRLDGRPGLQRLLGDIARGETDFSAVLVQDVSRWGRFQDPDEAAHYEFLCRARGIEVRYCAEPLDDPRSPVHGLFRAVKRLMAADFSRELSAKSRRSHLYWAAAGYKMGGVPGYGLRRRLIGEDGRPRGLLGPGEHKALQGERVVLEPGPPQEVETVRRIFRLYLEDGLTLKALADRLNAEGVAGEDGRPWGDWSVGQVLGNEKYVGDYVFGRTARTLDGGRVRSPPGQVVRRRDALPALVSREVFAAARALRRRRRLFLGEAEMLAGAAALLATEGRLTQRGLDAAPDLPTQQTYRLHFGALPRLHARLGAYPPPPARLLPGCIDGGPRAVDEQAPLEDRPMTPAHYTAFAGDRRLAEGPLDAVAEAAWAAQQAGTFNLLVLDDATGAVVDLDLRGGEAEVRARHAPPEPDAEAPPARPARGRPKLGVEPREVTLLPRHWAWLARQPGGASAALRGLVEQALRTRAEADAARDAQTAAYKVLYALGGHLPHYEEALRALYAPDPARFANLISAWPEDIRAYVERLAGAAFARLAGPDQRPT